MNIFAPHSRHTKINEQEIKENSDLEILAYSNEAGATIIASKDRKQLFITCHLEYERIRLDIEFKSPSLNRGTFSIIV